VRPARLEPELPEAGAEHDRPAGPRAHERRRGDRGRDGPGRAAGEGSDDNERPDRPGVPADTRPRAGREGEGPRGRVLEGFAPERALPGAVQPERVRVPGLNRMTPPILSSDRRLFLRT